MRWMIAAAFAFLLWLAPGPARAWAVGGHYTVCEIGYLNLTATAKAEVDRPIVADRLKQAGIRLAYSLNRSFDPAYRGPDGPKPGRRAG